MCSISPICWHFWWVSTSYKPFLHDNGSQKAVNVGSKIRKWAYRMPAHDFFLLLSLKKMKYNLAIIPLNVPSVLQKGQQGSCTYDPLSICLLEICKILIEGMTLWYAAVLSECDVLVLNLPSSLEGPGLQYISKLGLIFSYKLLFGHSRVSICNIQHRLCLC